MARPEDGAVVDAAMLLILVVEDESLIQDIVREALEDGGFQTEITASGEEAVTLLDKDSTKYRALLTDVHLKGDLTGWDVAKRARERDQSRDSSRLHDGSRRHRLAVSWRAQQRPFE
jgi:CheY-like chemotaxis protein